MKQLEMSDWMVINNIIYKIYTMKDLTIMRQELLEQMKMIFDFDSAGFFLATGNKDHPLKDPVTYNFDGEQVEKLEAQDYSKDILYTGKSIVYRETDIISDEKRVKMEYYKKVYVPNNWHYSLQFILGKEKEFLGVITFYRFIGKDNFTYDDIFLLDMLKEHLSHRLWESAREKKVGMNKLTVSQASVKYDLTKQEGIILKLLLEGKENQEICDELVISMNTFKKHVLNIYRKLHINNRVQMFKLIREQE